jgi:hypothetical protein
VTAAAVAAAVPTAAAHRPRPGGPGAAGCRRPAPARSSGRPGRGGAAVGSSSQGSGLLAEADGVLQVEPANVGPPGKLQVEVAGPGPPQPRCGSDRKLSALSNASPSSNRVSPRRVQQACSSVWNAPSRARGEDGIGMAAQPASHDRHRQAELRNYPCPGESSSRPCLRLACMAWLGLPPPGATILSLDHPGRLRPPGGGSDWCGPRHHRRWTSLRSFPSLASWAGGGGS